MKIPIAISKLTDSPYSSDRKESFYFDDDYEIDQVVTLLKRGNPSSFLISGYRGVGKTSYVNRIREKVGSDTIFVNISIARYDGYAILVKNLIRQLYISFEKKKKNSEKAEEQQLLTAFSKLYDRTFYEISETVKSSLSQQHKIVYAGNWHFGKLIPPVLSTLFFGLSVPFNFLKSLTASVTMFIVSVFWAVVSGFSLIRSEAESRYKSDDTLRKTLYDDEIAEHHLFKILDQIKRNDIAIVIVFDELDKVKELTIVEQVINDVKVLLLSGYANFFVIAGQGLYYQLENASGTDDAVISSLFSKKIHVPFLRYLSLKAFFLSLVPDASFAKEEIVNSYIESLILESSRIPRRLSNIIRDRLVWEGDQAYLIVHEESREYYIRESTIFQILAKMSDNDLPGFTSDRVKLDFFIAHLHLWLSRIKQFRSTDFSIRQVVDDNSNQDMGYPASYTSQLAPLCQLFLDRLEEGRILTKQQRPNDSIPFYSWTASQIAKIEVVEGEDEVKGTFLQEYTDLERVTRGIYTDFKGEIEVGRSYTLEQTVTLLISDKVLKESWKTAEPLLNLISLRDRLSHGIAITTRDLDIVEKAKFNILRLKYEFLEEYFLFIVQDYFQNQSLSVGQARDSFDLVVRLDALSLFIDLKQLRTDVIRQHSIRNIIERIKTNEQTSKTENFYALFYHQSKSTRTFSTFRLRFAEMMDQVDANLTSKVFIYNISDDQREITRSLVVKYLDALTTAIQIKSRTQDSSPFIAPAIDNHVIFSGFEENIRAKAIREWPDDYQMQQYEIENQTEAVNKLKFGRPDDIPEKDFKRIRDKARSTWPSDYVMWLYEEQSQIEAYRRLNGEK